jgi:branched-chain amino acid transport system ATP-binding protein
MTRREGAICAATHRCSSVETVLLANYGMEGVCQVAVSTALQESDVPADQSPPPILEVRSVTKRFGGLTAVNNCSLSVKPGTITGLVGPNGAGKTTLLNLISGFQRVDGGEIVFNGAVISRMRAHGVFHEGLVRTFQVPRPIPTMTVLENLVLAGADQAGEHVWNTWFRPKLIERQENEIIDRALWVLDYVNLAHLRDEYAANLSGGQKKLLEFARTLMVQPKMVLLDEPGAGINRTLMLDLMKRIEEQCYEHGMTFLIIEHDMDVIARLCDPVIVMSQGAPIFEGPFQEMSRNQEVLDAYLGSQYR